MPSKPTGPSTADVLRAKLANCRSDIASLKKDLKAGYSKTLSDLIREAEDTEVELANRLQDELARRRSRWSGRGRCCRA